MGQSVIDASNQIVIVMINTQTTAVYYMVHMQVFFTGEFMEHLCPVPIAHTHHMDFFHHICRLYNTPVLTTPTRRRELHLTILCTIPGCFVFIQYAVFV